VIEVNTTLGGVEITYLGVQSRCDRDCREKDKIMPGTFVHENGHYYQQISTGWANMAGKSLVEAIEHGDATYNILRTIESSAMLLESIYYHSKHNPVYNMFILNHIR
jgi:hypothetical protein